MDSTSLLTEGDINTSEERLRWDTEIFDIETLQILEDDARYFFHQSMSSPCLDVAEQCNGSSITTLSGRHFLDFHGNNVHQTGYGNKYVIKKVTEQMNKLSFSPRRYTNKPAVDLAKKLAEILPGDLNRSLFAPGGTSAVGMALKLARVVTGKYKLISLWDSFHGASLDAISAGGEAIFKKYMGPMLPGVINIPPPSSYRGLFGNTEEDQIKFANYIEYVIENEGNIGAFISETIRNTDVEIPTRAYWKRVREICTKHGVLLILDEIPNALGRTGSMFSFEHFDIEPDILCIGKGLGGGIIHHAAMIARDSYNIAGDVSLGHYTFEKNPLGCTAALATIEYIEKEKILEKVIADGLWMHESLNNLKKRFSIIGDVRGIGLLWGIELVNDHFTKERATIKAEKIMYDCMGKGLSFKISHGNIIQLSPSLTISRDDLKKSVTILTEVFESNS
jgi:4-aminobutyrate aminotransferase